MPFVACYSDERLADGRQRVVRHGFGPQRTIETGIGSLDVRRPKVRDRADTAGADEKARFSSNILPKWARRPRSLDALLPVLYLRVISMGDFREALSALLGPDATNLSPGVISRLTAGWQKDYEAFLRRDTGGQEGTGRLSGRIAGKHAELARLLVDLKGRGLCVPPDLAVGDGALGFWKALEEVFPQTAHQQPSGPYQS